MILDEIMRQLFANLSSEEREKFDEYDVEHTLQMNRQDELVYSQGLVMGFSLATGVDQMRRNPEKFYWIYGYRY